jgi:hypothetical protein
MIRVPLREGRTLHHDADGHFGAGRVVIRAAEAGTGIIAGGPVRAIFEALGVHDVVAHLVIAEHQERSGRRLARRARRAERRGDENEKGEQPPHQNLQSSVISA